MPANPNWVRWVFASIAFHLKEVATDNSIPVLVEHLDERSEAFMEASDRAEIRITGPFTEEQSQDYFRFLVDANVLLTSRYDGAKKDAYSILKNAGLFHEAMSLPIPIWNYGGEPGDYVDADPESQVFLGCLLPQRPVRVFNFGQNEKTDKLKQTAVDARYEMYLFAN